MSWQSFPEKTLDALRQPVEDKKVSVARVNGAHTYPANFMFVTAMNPCPCGYYPSSKCRCTDYEIIKYRGKISGSIMDRIDIQKEVHPVDFFDMENKTTSYSSAELRKKVEAARKIQQIRYASEEEINCNAQMTTSLIKKYCKMDAQSLDLLKETSEKYGWQKGLMPVREPSASIQGLIQLQLLEMDSIFAIQQSMSVLWSG